MCELITCDGETVYQAASVVPVVCPSNPSEAPPTVSDSGCDSMSRVVSASEAPPTVSDSGCDSMSRVVSASEAPPTVSDSGCDSMSRVVSVMGEEYVECALDIPICDIPDAPPLARNVKVRHLKNLLTVVSEVLPSALYIEYRHHSQLQEGDVVAIRSEWEWQSFAMVSSTMEGAENMICFVNHNGQPVSDMDALLWREGVALGEVVMEDVLGMEYGPVTIIRHENRDLALRNARSALGREWNLFCFNSEHFVTWAMTGEAKCQQLVNLEATPEHCGEELISDTVTTGEAVKSAAKAVAIHLTKETAEEAVSKTTAISVGRQMASGAKAGLFGGVVVEGACLAYSVHGAYQQMQRDEISQEQFRHRTVKETGAASGSVAGGVAGAAIGSVVIPIPVVGTIVGGVVGGIVGSVVGSKVGEATDDAVFGSQ